jgi:transposase-like protein
MVTYNATPIKAQSLRVASFYDLPDIFPNSAKIRCCPYLNNVVEQDYRRIKFRVQPMLGFKTFYNARHVLTGIELLQKIVKGQFCLPAHFRSSFHSIWRTALTS